MSGSCLLISLALFSNHDLTRRRSRLTHRSQTLNAPVAPAQRIARIVNGRIFCISQRVPATSKSARGFHGAKRTRTSAAAEQATIPIPALRLSFQGLMPLARALSITSTLPAAYQRHHVIEKTQT